MMKFNLRICSNQSPFVRSSRHAQHKHLMQLGENMIDSVYAKKSTIQKCYLSGGGTIEVDIPARYSDTLCVVQVVH